MRNRTPRPVGFVPMPNRLHEDKRVRRPTIIAVYFAVAALRGPTPALSSISTAARLDETTARRELSALASLGFLPKSYSRLHSSFNPR